MDFNEYQQKAHETAQYPLSPSIIVENQISLNSLPLYPFLKLSGESGEISEKIGKVIRDQSSYLPEDKIGLNCKEYDITVTDLIKEMGDVLWYLSEIATQLGITLNYIAEINIEKLSKRKQNGTIKGSGDNR